MPNPVAVNDLSPISGSLQTSRVSYGVETAGKNYGQNYNSTNWYSDIPNNGQFYTIISDNYTANYYVSRSNAGGAYVEGGLPAVDEYSAPVFWITQGTSSLDVITIVNGLPDRVGQVPFNSGSQALNWVASSSNYFAVGPDYYDQIDADNLRLYLDANQVISYPTTQSTWYNISGYNLINNLNATLTNGPVFSPSSGSIIFDGVDDYAIIGKRPELNIGGDLTVEAIIRVNNTFANNPTIVSNGYYSEQYPYKFQFNGSSAKLGLFRSDGTYRAGEWTYGNLSTYFLNKTVHVVTTATGSTFNVYYNGVAQSLSTTSPGEVTVNNTTNTVIGGQIDSSGGNLVDAFPGEIYKIRIYSKTLTAAEVAQNYYGGPIVTDGLFLAQDAGNLVSYPRSGTALYDLTTNNFSGVLTNGVGFSTEVGGALTFDGVNDYVVTNVSTPNITSKTLEVWVRLNDVSQQGGGAINLQYDGGGQFDAIVYNETGQGWGFGSDGFYRTAWSGVVETSTAQWIHMVATYQNNNFRMYRNGILILTTTSFTTLNYNTDSESLLGLRHNGATHLNASIAVGRIYSRALTQAEVLQNYNASF